MTDYTIFGTGTPAGLSTDPDGLEVSVSTAFYVLGVSGWRCAGVRIWIPAGTTLGSGTKIAYLWTGTGSAAPTSVIATANFSSLVAGAWNTVLFSSPVSMIAGKYYWAQVYLPAGGYGYIVGKFTGGALSSVDTGSLYASSVGEVSPGNGSFVYGAAGLAPSGTSGGSWYGVDVVVDDGTSGASGPGSSDNVGIADTVTVVRSGLPTAVHASATATDTSGLSASNTATFAIGGATAFHTERRTLNEIRVSWGAISNTSVRGPSFATESSGPLTVGLEFKVLWPCRFVGCNIYKNPNANGSIPVRLWDRQGSGGASRELGITTIPWVADAGGWREVIFGAAIDLVPDVTYTVTYYSPSADFCHQPYVFYVKSLVATPIVVAPFRSETLKGGSVFRQGTLQTMPDLYSPSDYYLDPIVEYDSTDPVYVPDAGKTYFDQWTNGHANHKIVIGVFNADAPFLAEYFAMGVNSLIGAPGDAVHINKVKEVGMDFYPDAGLDTDGVQHVVINNVMEDPALAALVPGYYVIDEPDQYFPYTPPNITREWCNSIRVLDASRPLYMGLGGVVSKNQSNTHQPQGSTMDEVNVLWREWAQQGDILSGDWYNMSPNYDPEGTYGVWTYPVFVRRLQTLNEGRTPIILAVETTSQVPNYPVPDNVRKAMWAAIIQGAIGFELFDHRFPNSVVSLDFAHMLHNPPMKSMMTAMIARINSLADAILGPNTHLVTAWTTSNMTSGPLGGTWGVPMHYTTRTDATYEYLFAMGIRPGSTTATFTIPSWVGQTLTVIDESRTVTVSGAGVLTDDFPADYTVHIYRKG